MAEEHECSECGRKFDSERGLHIHQSQVHGEVTGEPENELWEKTTAEYIPVEHISVREALLTGLMLGVVLGVLLVFMVYKPLDVSGPEDVMGEDNSSDSTDTWAFEIERNNSPVLGDENASIDIIIYQDYACENCRKFQAGEGSPLEFMKDRYVETGDARIVWKSFPSSSRNWSMEAAIGMKCVHREAPDTFFEVKKRLFENQEKVDGTDLAKDITRWMNTTRTEKSSVKQCMENRETVEAVNREKRLAVELGVYIAPTVIIDDGVEKSYWRLNGLKTSERYDSVIKSALASNRQRAET